MQRNKQEYMRDYNQVYRAKNAQYYQEYAKSYYLNNKSELLEYSRKHYILQRKNLIPGFIAIIDYTPKTIKFN